MASPFFAAAPYNSELSWIVRGICPHVVSIPRREELFLKGREAAGNFFLTLIPFADHCRYISQPLEFGAKVDVFLEKAGIKDGW